MTELEQKVIDWARERNLTDYNKQFLKLVAEVGELSDEFCKAPKDLLNIDEDSSFEAYDNIISELGDVFVCAVILADQLGYDPEDVLQNAYNKIKNRKGKTINNTFVKE